MTDSRTRVSALAAGLLVLALIAVAATVALPGVFHSLERLSPDSTTYLEWNAGRTPAYPAFLSVIRLVSPGLEILGPIQLLVFLASAAWCALSFARTSGHPWIALLLGASVMWHPQLVSYAFVVLPESLFASTLLVNLGVVLEASRSKRSAPYALVGLTLAVLILLKPSGYGVAAGLVAVALCARARAAYRVGSAVAALGISLGAVATMNFFRHGYFATQAQGGFVLLAHVGPFVERTEGGPLAEVTNAIADDVKPHRDALERIDDLVVYYLFSSHDYHTIERIVRQRIGADVERRFGSAAADTRQFPSNPILLREITAQGSAIARRAIVDHPHEYARHVSSQLYGLWFIPLFQTSAGVDRLNSALNDIRATSAALDRSPVAFRALPAPVFVAIRVLQLTVLGASLVMILFVLLHRTPHDLALGYAALALHANFLLVAAVQPGLPRYAIVMWPCATLLLAGCAARVADFYMRRT